MIAVCQGQKRHRVALRQQTACQSQELADEECLELPDVAADGRRDAAVRTDPGDVDIDPADHEIRVDLRDVVPASSSSSGDGDWPSVSGGMPIPYAM